MKGKNIAILVGGSDLFLGLRGISTGTIMIKNAITALFDEVHAVNYNYFLDFGRSLASVKKQLTKTVNTGHICLYGYSKGGDVVLQVARQLEKELPVELLITIDIANGPWSHSVNRSVPGNVKNNINVFQSNPNTLRSYGAETTANGTTELQNIDLTNTIIDGRKVTHGNIEMLMAPKVIEWITVQRKD